ncbi:MAG: glycoside hydrolase family 3 C-terminal domain-containing protein [Bacteroidales bacterium]|nr:glycoside hydrolase family 3 C-terminal domain-containing protein [Candidatus Cacconaster merdequi]
MKTTDILIVAAVGAIAFCSCKVTNDPVEKKVESVLKTMSLEEKAGQMVQINLDMVYDQYTQTVITDKLDYFVGEKKIGSFLNVPGGHCPDPAEMTKFISALQQKSMETMGIPTIYGLDMIHGSSYYADATIFPQEVNIAATFNPEFAAAMGKSIGYETRAGMVPWTFSPVMDLSRNAAWPRNWESYGEDPLLQSVMASTETRAIQGEDRNNIDQFHCAVSIKHYLGYGAPATGKDRTPAYIDYPTLREKYFAPFKACIEAGALSLMVNSASINGIPMHANYELLTKWLKEELDWDGMIVTDWADINNLYTREYIAKDKKDAIRIGINAGIDMIMEPYDADATDLICELVREGKIKKSRIDDAVRRILRLKVRLGLFDAPVWDAQQYTEYGCREFADASYRAAVESEVLLKNENKVLPLNRNSRILVTGPNANTMRALNGGWTYSWQGSDNLEYGERFNTILEALQKEFTNVTYIPAISYDEAYGQWQNEFVSSFEPAVAAARNSDVIVVCLGENTYCETPGNIDDINISENQTALVKALSSTGKPIVTILNEGRPRVVREIERLSSAVVDIMLPGNYGADALADLLSGDENFSGKLPFTYPKYPNSIHTYDYKVSENQTTMEGAYNYDAKMDVQWEFGHGLSYSNFEYSDLTVNRTCFKTDDTLEFCVKVRNTSGRSGKESVLLYSSDMVASRVPDVRRLRAFEKVSLEPGEEAVVKLRIPASELAFVGTDCKWTLEEGDFRISAGNQAITIHCNKTKIWEGPNRQ